MATEAENENLSKSFQNHTLTETDSACIFDQVAMSTDKFQQKLREMPTLLQEAGIVFTEQLFDIKPLLIPLEAVKSAIACQPPKHCPSVFMNTLQKVANDPKLCAIVSNEKQFALPKEVFQQALAGVGVCNPLIFFAVIIIYLAHYFSSI